MGWLKRQNAPLNVEKVKKDVPDGLWTRCSECSEIVFKKDFESNLNVCPKCSHHFAIDPMQRIEAFLDKDSFEEYDQDIESPDPLEFFDSKPYKDRLLATQKKTGRKDAFVSGRGLLMGKPVHIGVFDFGFMGGSMGSVVGEKISRLLQKALETREPAIIVSSSGGARMQEGILSLMQMGKTCAVLSKFKTSGVPYISVLSHPTTGGVAASFAMLGDINIGEPGALIGFAGPRVIKETIGEELPEGFQTAEYLLDHGMLDMICHRDQLRPKIAEILDLLVMS